MSDENTARHAECTVEFDGVDITSSIKPYLLSLTFTDNEEDASDDLQIKLQDREGVWMPDWLQKMLDGDVSAASSDARPRSPSSSRARCTRTMLFTRTERPGSMAGSMPARSPVNLAAVLPAAVKVA